MIAFRKYSVVLLLGLLLGPAGLEAANKANSVQMKFFEMRVRPLLAEHCYSCHGPDKQKAGLRLDSLEAIQKGSRHGAVVESGKPDGSLLITAVRRTDPDLQMPPKKALNAEQVKDLENWVQLGMPWPETKATHGGKGGGHQFTDEDRSWWAFQPVKKVSPPKADASAGIVKNELDPFVLRKLQKAGLKQAPLADRRSLVRRLYYQVLGVPPTAEEVEKFVNDQSTTPYEDFVDRLLADPRYGQNWGRYWLDVVRYAESDGYRQDAYRNEIWRYRDYVVKAFNEDMPYKQFLMEQLAGDEIAPEDPEVLVATGFLRLGVYEYNLRDAEGQWKLITDELTDTVGDVFLGMGMGCARCHDHKFDPILQKDYYRLQAFFKPLLWRDDIPLTKQAEIKTYHAALKKWEEKNRELLDKIEAIEGPARIKQENKSVTMFPNEVQAMYRKPKEERTAYENQIADLVHRQVLFEYTRLKNGIPKDKHEEWEKLKKQLQDLTGSKPKALPGGMLAMDAEGEIPPTSIPGSRREEIIEPGILSILDPSPIKVNHAKVAREGSSGRRLALAEWLADDENPLTARVMVNRIWQHHFGTGLAANTSDFGRLGEAPSHPELFDWLTADFVKHGWKLKHLHKKILMSATFRQSTTPVSLEMAMKVDPTNRMLWRFPPRRLRAEEIRDSMLTVSGELKKKESGKSVSGNDPYRAVFTRLLRNSPDPLLETFDAPTGFSSEAKRNLTTTAIQSLLMINGAWTSKRASVMAGRLVKTHKGNHKKMVETAFHECFGRKPRTEEVEGALGFIKQQLGMIEPKKSNGAEADSFLDNPEMQLWGTAFNMEDKRKHAVLRLNKDVEPFAKGNFTVEAIVYHRTMFKDASVRVIAAEWNGSNSSRGWNLGVTSEKSAYRPRNLILQLVGDDVNGKVKYEVVASDLRIPSNKPYYVSASVDFEKGTATFFARDMSYDESELETAVVKHSIRGGCVNPPVQFTLGGRDNASRTSNWDGLIDDVRLTRGTLTNEDDLLIYNPNNLVVKNTRAMWRFSRADERGLGADLSPENHLLELVSKGNSQAGPLQLAMTDFCHVLLNSNEFIYLD